MQKVITENIARKQDPGPMWMAYIKGSEAFERLFGEPTAIEGFYLRPRPTYICVNGVKVREYGEIRKGTWWEEADKAVRPNCSFLV